jgi:hypothetical protein
MSHIFISYSHKDKTYAHRLQQHLLEQGFNVWMDDRIEYGANWPREIERRLKECAVFILIMSPNSSESRSVQNELVFVQELNKPIFPLLLDGEGWWHLKSTQHLDVKKGKLPPPIFIDCLAKFAPRLDVDGSSESQVQVNEKLQPKSRLKKVNIIGTIVLLLIVFGLIFWALIYLPKFFPSVIQNSTLTPTATLHASISGEQAIIASATPSPTEPPATLATVASVTATSVPEIASPTATETAISPPDYSCVTVNEQPAENTQIRRGKTFKVMFTVVNNGATVWPENLKLDISSNPYGTIYAPSLPMRVPRVQPGDFIVVGPFDAKAPTKDGHYVVSFKIGDGFCLPYVAFDVIK